MKIKQHLKAAAIAVLFTWCIAGIFALVYAIYWALNNWLGGRTADFAFISIVVSGVFWGFYVLALAQFKKKEK